MPARARHDDLSQFVGVVVVEAFDEAEPVAERARDHAGTGRGTDERERRHRQPDAGRRGPLAHHDVELEVLHGRVQDLFDGPREAVDLIDEQEVAFFELGEDGGEVAGAFERRTGRDVKLHTHLGRDDPGEGGLAEPWGPGEQQVVDRLLAVPRRFEHDDQMFFQFSLADELLE